MPINSKKVLFFAALYCALLTVIHWFQPDRTGQLVDTDEPLTAMRALLYHQGFKLHEQVWSDQPPLLSVIVSWTLYFSEPSLELGRLVVTAFGALLATSLAFAVFTQSGIGAAAIAVILLLASGRFLRLSGALMIGLPALSFAMTSIALLLASAGKRRVFLILSGFAFACGLVTKLFVVFTLPAIATFFALHAWDRYKGTRSFRSALLPAVIWGSSASICALAIVATVAPALLRGYAYQLLEGHEKLRESFHGDQLGALLDLAREDFYIFILAGVGIVCGLVRLRREYLVPLVWFCVAIQFLRHHHPVWVHHYVLYSVPGIWLASLAVSELWSSRHQSSTQAQEVVGPSNAVQSSRKLLLVHRWVLRPIVGALCAWAIIVVPQRLLSKTENLRQVSIGINGRLLKRVQELKPSITWMISDSPAFPFLLNIPVIPELGLIPQKRLSSGELTTEQIVQLIHRYNPEVILVHRFHELRGQLVALLAESYSIDAKSGQILVRRDIASRQ